LEKVRPRVPKELVDACSNAVADARELKSAASFIFKADGALITKVSLHRGYSTFKVLTALRSVPPRPRKTQTHPSARCQGAVVATLLIALAVRCVTRV
jgi:hypothetical protein